LNRRIRFILAIALIAAFIGYRHWQDTQHDTPHKSSPNAASAADSRPTADPSVGAAIFSLAGFINAIYARDFEGISVIPTFVLTPLTYLGGVFYSVDLLGEPWRTISHFNPILYMVNAFRYGMLGVSDIGIAKAYALIVALAAALYCLAWYLMHRGIGLRD